MSPSNDPHEAGDEAGGARHGAVPARWTAVASVSTRALAGLLAAELDDAGLATRVVSDDAGGVLPHIGVLTGGVHVQVPDADVEVARAVLADLDGAVPDTDGRDRGERVAGSAPRMPWRLVVSGVLALALAIAVGGAFVS